jgi:hypothetical protein
MNEKNEVVIFEGKEFTAEWPPQNAVMFLLWLQRQLASVAVTSRNDVRIEIGHDSQDGSYITLSHPTPKAVARHAVAQPGWTRLTGQAADQHA